MRKCGIGILAVLAVLGSDGCAEGSVTSPWENEDEDQPGIVLFEWNGDQQNGETPAASQSSEFGIFVNPLLWWAARDTLSFMPIASTDAVGGTILSDWYELPESAGERFKIDVYVLTPQLRTDGLRVAVFRRLLDAGRWVDALVDPLVASGLEEIILERARLLQARQ